MSKRILFISDTIVVPVERGNRKRVYNLIESVRKEGCEVDFLYLKTYSEEDPEPTRKWIGEEHFLSFSNRKRSFSVFLKRKVRFVLELLHIPGLFKYFTVDERISPDIDVYMKELLSKRHYDIVWSEYIYTSRALLSVPEGTLKVIDTHNAFTFKRQMYEAVGYRNYEFALTKEREREGLKRADWVIAIQEEEEKFFRSILPGNDRICTIGENMPLAQPCLVKEPVILFLGSFYVVNREGVRHFIEKIIPILKRRGVKFRFWLAGSICKHIPDSEDYEKLGYVEDVTATYEKARLVINPVHVGTGLNIKTIEALSHAKPLVSHEVGVRGLHGEKPIALVAEEDEAYADAIEELLTNDEKAMELSRNAYEYMQQYTKKNNENLKRILEDSGQDRK